MQHKKFFFSLHTQIKIVQQNDKLIHIFWKTFQTFYNHPAVCLISCDKQHTNKVECTTTMKAKLPLTVYWMQHKLVCVKYSYIHIHRRIFVLGICERGITELVCMISTWICKGWYGTLPILSSDLAVAFRYTIMEGYKMWRLCIFVPVFLLIEVWFRLGMLWIAIIGLRAGVY